MTRLPVNIGIQTRLIAGIALVATVLALAVGWYWSSSEERELSIALAQRQQRMSDLVARSFAAPIWNLDGTAIGNLLDAVMADPEVQSIELNSVGVSAVPMLRERGTPALRPLRREFPILYQSGPDVRPTQVAQAVLVFSSELVERQVSHIRRFVGGLLAAVLAAVVGTCYVLVNRFVKQPVETLGALARRVADGELGARAEVGHADEIGQLTQQFNSMSERLLASSRRLTLSEERYRSLFENAAEGIFQADSRGRLLGVNRALAQMLGFASPEQALAVGTRLRALVQVERPEYKRVASALQRFRLLQQVPLLIATREGRQLWVELSAHVVPTTDGQGTRIEGMVSDISQRRLAEQELTHHRDHLEDLVAERTLELSEAKRRAEAASEAKSRFLATMSHEFRTPLNAILGFTQLLQMDSSLGATQQNKIGLIRDSGEHLLNLISDVLDTASIEAGKVRLQPSSVDLRALLDMACDSVRLRLEQKRLHFDVDLSQQLPPRVLVDGQRLRQVLLNLLSNAVKFTDQGQVSLLVRVLGQEAGQVRLQFEVGDTGIGIAQHQLGRLFQPFEQVVDDARCLGGTGLGLSISQQLVREMGSEIRVHSEFGRGSQFTFELSLPTTA
ncbi:ATP-binding protein [Paucibacter sp. AS339]|uniref:ATP-binding protein n=1 Tax=Paucibacter hankyongi TaxID=3133434 RepID=UPI00309FDE76